MSTGFLDGKIPHDGKLFIKPLIYLEVSTGKIISVITSVLGIFSILGAMVFFADTFESAKEGDTDEVINKSFEYMEDKFVSDVKTTLFIEILAIILTIVSIIVGFVVALLKFIKK